jgi:hypothetical protein
MRLYMYLFLTRIELLCALALWRTSCAVWSEVTRSLRVTKLGTSYYIELVCKTTLAKTQMSRDKLVFW